jgi:tRNA threonylcarbamoyladenosine biosynthesis protein TsaB
VAPASAPSTSRSLAEPVAPEIAVVGFDTATADTAVGAMRDGEVLVEESIGPGADGPRHSTALLAAVEAAATTAGGWSGVDRIAVGLGPGSFVGIRIAIATANGLAASTGLPLTGVCTLDAVAAGLLETGHGRECLAVLDARRGEVFAALYTPTGERVWEPFVVSPDELAERFAERPASPLAGGPGAVRFRAKLARCGADVPDDSDPVHRVAARHLCALATMAGDADGAPEPIYLRPPDAERWRDRDTSQRSE